MTQSSIDSNTARINTARINATFRVKEVLRTAVPALQRLHPVDTEASRAEARRVVGLPADDKAHYIWDSTSTVGLDAKGECAVKGKTPAELDRAMSLAKDLARHIIDRIDVYMAGIDAETDATVAQFDKAAR